MGIPNCELPADITAGATLSGNEYGWNVDSFPVALRRAEEHGLACLGGQFQFRIADAIYEMYWLTADSTERRSGETWADYVHRSCDEVHNGFQKLVAQSDFVAEVSGWPMLKAGIQEEHDVLSKLVFVAYFVTEAELNSI
jgi:hypothetical protein